MEMSRIFKIEDWFDMDCDYMDKYTGIDYPIDVDFIQHQRAILKFMGKLFKGNDKLMPYWEKRKKALNKLDLAIQIHNKEVEEHKKLGIPTIIEDSKLMRMKKISINEAINSLKAIQESGSIKITDDDIENIRLDIEKANYHIEESNKIIAKPVESEDLIISAQHILKVQAIMSKVGNKIETLTLIRRTEEMIKNGDF